MLNQRFSRWRPWYRPGSPNPDAGSDRTNAVQNLTKLNFFFLIIIGKRTIFLDVKSHPTINKLFFEIISIKIFTEKTYQP